MGIMRNAVTAGLLMLMSACAKDAPTIIHVTMETGAGVIGINLYPDQAPVTVENFLRYVDANAYAGAAFYRTTRPDNDPLITVIQGGLWELWQEGGDEDFKPLFPPILHETTDVTGLSHGDGALSMARAEPGTASSEFFISIGDNPSLDFGGARNPDGQGFAVFGQVVEGMDVVRAIHQAPVRAGEGFEGQILVEPVAILSARRQTTP